MNAAGGEFLREELRVGEEPECRRRDDLLLPSFASLDLALAVGEGLWRGLPLRLRLIPGAEEEEEEEEEDEVVGGGGSGVVVMGGGRGGRWKEERELPPQAADVD